MLRRLQRVLKMASTQAPDYVPAAFVKADKPFISSDCVTGKAVKPEDVNVVFYHGHCPDGFAAAFAAWKSRRGAAAYVPLDHGQFKEADILDTARGKHVVVVDFCFKRELTAKLLDTAASFLVLDHHASAQVDLADVPDAHKVFQMLQSGATLSWNFFHAGTPVPLLLRYVEDRDIWRWALLDSEEVTTALQQDDQTFERYEELLAGGEDAVRALADKGRAIVDYKRDVVRSHANRAAYCTLKASPSFRGAVVNSSVMASELGNALCQLPGVQYGMVWSFDHESHSCRVSLRSDSDEVDVSVMAKQFGGGGHRRAAGFNHPGANVEELLLMGEMIKSKKATT